MVLDIDSNWRYHFHPNIQASKEELHNAQIAYVQLPRNMSYFSDMCKAARKRIQDARDMINLCRDAAA